jgi:hypothetical protein
MILNLLTCSSNLEICTNVGAGHLGGLAVILPTKDLQPSLAVSRLVEIAAAVVNIGSLKRLQKAQSSLCCLPGQSPLTQAQHVQLKQNLQIHRPFKLDLHESAQHVRAQSRLLNAWPHLKDE